MIEQIFHRMTATLKSNPGLFFRLAASNAAFSELATQLAINVSFVFWILVPVGWALAQYIAVALVAAARLSQGGARPTMRATLDRANVRFMPSALYALQYSLVAMVASLFLLVPGIVAAWVFAFTWLIPIVEDDEQLNPFRISRRLVAANVGTFAKIVVAVIVVAVIWIALSTALPSFLSPVVSFVGTCLFFTVGAVGQYELYIAMRERTYANGVPPEERAWLRGGARFGWTSTLVAVVVVMVLMTGAMVGGIRAVGVGSGGAMDQKLREAVTKLEREMRKHP